MNHLFARRVILCGGKSQGTSVGQLHDILDRPFPERCLPDHNRALQILQRTRDDFGAAGAALVHQDGQRKFRALFGGGRSGVLALLGSDATLGGNDGGVWWQKLRAHVDRAVEQPAGIVSQIKHERLHPLLLQLVQSLGQIFRRGLVKLDHSHIPNLECAGEITVDQMDRLHALHFHFCTFQDVVLHLPG